ncbi:MAG: choice-of-anchor Q domain-containing protein [Ignavibacteriales bacterium]
MSLKNCSSSANPIQGEAKKSLWRQPSTWACLAAIVLLLASANVLLFAKEKTPDSKIKVKHKVNDKITASQENQTNADTDTQNIVRSDSAAAVLSTSTAYYVSTTGSNLNDGLSETSPFKTISKAVSVAQAGETILVRGGIYNEKITMPYSGTADNPIVMQNYPSETPIIDGTGIAAVDDGALLTISSKSYIKIIGFEVRNYVSPNARCVMGIRVDGGDSQGIEIRNCKVHDIRTTYSGSNANRNAHAIAVYGTIKDLNRSIDGIIIDGNEVYNCKLGQSEAITFNGNVTNFQVTNNRVHDNDNIGICMIGFEGTANNDNAGVASAMQDRARHGLCAQNQVWNISSGNNPTYGEKCADAIYVDGGYDILIERNIVDNSDIGVEAASEHKGCKTQYITIRNNLITKCKGVGGILFGGASRSNGTATDVKIFNNTLYNNEPHLGIGYANSSTNEVKNNICYVGTYLEGTKGNNVISNNRTANPLFVNIAAKDFHLQASSPAINKGVVVNYGDVDLDGNPRVQGSAVDQGCYEYIP